MKIDGGRNIRRRSVEDLRGLKYPFEVCSFNALHRFLGIIAH